MTQVELGLGLRGELGLVARARGARAQGGELGLSLG